MRKPLLAIAAIAIVATTAGVAAPAAPLRMTVGALGHVGSIDPRHGDSAIAREVWNLQYLTLTSLNPETLEPTTGLADGWRPAPGPGWIYTIRDGLKWTDGTAVTAADVVYSLDHARDEHWPYAAGMLDGLRARAVNDHAVEVTSDHRRSPGLLLHVVPAKVFSKYPDIDHDPAAFGVGDGSWHVITKDASVVTLGVLGRPGGPPLDQIVFRTYPNADALINALAHGDADVISGAPAADITHLDTMAHVTVDHAPDGTEYRLRFAARFTDPSLRRVVKLAIDGRALVAVAVHGVGTAIAPGAQPTRARRELRAIPGSLLEPTLVIPKDPTGRRVGAFVHEALGAIGMPTNEITSGTEPTNAPHADLVVERVDAGERSPDAIGLFEPDTLQAFRSDNVTGFLREPADPSLVVFGPTVSQYGAITAAQKPPGEQLSNLAYALGAAGLLVLFAGAYWFASLLRKRHAT